MYKRTDLDDIDNQRQRKEIPSLREETAAIGAIASGVAKAVLYICCTIAMGILLSKCQLDSETITKCEQACSTQGTKMESVTNQRCKCVAADDPSLVPAADVWVLP